ncbi:MAG: SRPBCC family protein [Syntrophobacteraceae bacterium]|jgi:hypothetical protein|nr:SRPBCC family protein [Syntrophobacteraceae bacterium]
MGGFIRRLLRLGPALRVSRVIQAPPSAVWDILVDTEQWPRWGPSVRAVRCPRRRIDQGAEGAVQTTMGIWLPFVITELLVGSSWSWEVASVPATGHRLRPLGGLACEVSFEVPLLAAPYLLVCRVALRRIARLAERPRH